MASTDPHRGEVWLAAFGKSRNGEPGMHRPAVVVSADALLSGTPRELVVVVPLSTSLSGQSLVRPVISADSVSGVDRDCVANCVALRGVTKDRLLERYGTVPPDTMGEIERGLRAVLDLV